MPLIMMCGFPCSGKTTIAKRIAKLIESKTSMKIVLINCESLGLDRNKSYKDSLSEKSTRGMIKSAVERSLNRDTVVICDCLNYIKGFRYELYCVARTCKTPSCVVFVHVGADKANLWNSNCGSISSNAGGRSNSAGSINKSSNDSKERDNVDNKGDDSRVDENVDDDIDHDKIVDGNENKDEEGNSRWNSDLLMELTRRFEMPISSRRWEKPTFVATDSDYQTLPLNELLAYLAEQTQVVHGATQKAVMSDANYLHSLDKVTQDIVRSLLKQQRDVPLGAPLSVPHTDNKVSLQKFLGMAEAQRIRRQFVSLNRSLSATLPSFGKVTTSESADAFVQYLNTNLV